VLDPSLSDVAIAIGSSSLSLFRATQLYSAVKGWESANHPYRILPDL
jgi:hypothetical protein